MVNSKFNSSQLFTSIPQDVLENLGPEGKEYLEELYKSSGDSSSELADLKQVTESFLLDAGLEQPQLDVLLDKFFDLKFVESDIPATIIPPKTSILNKPTSNLKSSVVEKSLPFKPTPKNVEKTFNDDSSNPKPQIKPILDPQNTQSSAPSAPKIVAFSQSSRFHTETLITNLNEVFLYYVSLFILFQSLKVNLKDVNIIVNDTILLEDAHLQLKEGFHYGLIGRNGTGKSTLLNCMAKKTLLGFPENIRVQYVEQLEVHDDERTVLQTVLDADEERTRVLSTISEIEHGLNSSPEVLKSIIDSYLSATANEEILQAQKLANFRTGRRGQDARKVALEREKNALSDITNKFYQNNTKSDSQVANMILDEKYKELTQASN
ncbi:ABC transporter F family member 3 [Smittium mucronatum]|uniref:ABC transporter F family member 3 n=1 Tax=Smittium mucronatum TaxID=133383 RepID=A0A1R0GQP5_9FUNG|nr:ABC transporter F family member 3 [Smittium mucronatum]